MSERCRKTHPPARSVRSTPSLQAFYANTLTHIRQQKAKGGDVAARYDTLQV
jgi:hypothetical protein